MLIKLDEKDIQKCQEFANQIDTGFYASRGQGNDSKRTKDQVIGKVAEIAAYNYLKSKEIDSSYPDFAIYAKGQKSWAHDMQNLKYNFHIKSQSVEQGKRYGTSFVFEKTDKKIFEKYTEIDYVFFISIDLPNKTADIKSILKLEDLHKHNLFKPMKLAHLTSKLAIYFDDVSETFKDNLYLL